MIHPRGPTYTPLAYFHSRFRHFNGDGFSRHFENKFSRTYFWKLISETHSRELISRLVIRDQNLIIPVPVPENGNGKIKKLSTDMPRKCWESRDMSTSTDKEVLTIWIEGKLFDNYRKLGCSTRIMFNGIVKQNYGTDYVWLIFCLTSVCFDST